jgi:hypothetical protein
MVFLQARSHCDSTHILDGAIRPEKELYVGVPAFTSSSKGRAKRRFICFFMNYSWVIMILI